MMKGLVKVAQIPPVHPEMIVTIMILEIPDSLVLYIENVDAPLKKSHETNKMMVPKTTKGKEFYSK